MMNRQTQQKPTPMRNMLQRMDRLAGDLNVLLLVVALGLATLDFTFFVTQRVVDNLPQVARVSFDAPNSLAK